MKNETKNMNILFVSFAFVQNERAFYTKIMVLNKSPPDGYNRCLYFCLVTFWLYFVFVKVSFMVLHFFFWDGKKL